MAITNEQRLSQGLAVAKLYYQGNQSQSQIAERLGISRPTVSRLLRLARQQGLVRIQIVDPVQDVQTLTQELRRRLGINVVVVAAGLLRQEQLRERVAHAAADLLPTMLMNHAVLGLGNGPLVAAVARFLPATIFNDVQAVQLSGNSALTPMNAAGIAAFDAVLHGHVVGLPLPPTFSQLQTKRLVEQDPAIRQVLALGKRADVVLFAATTAGGIGATAQVLAHELTATGRIADPQLDQRTVGLSLAALQAKAHAVLLSAGDQVVSATLAAIAGHCATDLIIDQHAAALLLAQLNRSQRTADR